MHEVSIPLLSELGPRALERLLDRSVTRCAPKGHVLFLESEPRTRVHFVLEGAFFLYRRDAGGSESVVGFASPGVLLDEVGLLDGAPHTCDAIAASDAHVLGIAVDTVRDELDRSPDMTRALVRQLEARVRWIDAAASERATCQVTGRIAGRLLDLARILGTHRADAIEMDLPIQQEQLGLLAATTRESACKAMRRLRRQGVLEYSGRRLRILRPDALHHLRCGERVAGPSRSIGEEAPRRSRSTSDT